MSSLCAKLRADKLSHSVKAWQPEHGDLAFGSERNCTHARPLSAPGPYSPTELCSRPKS